MAKLNIHGDISNLFIRILWETEKGTDFKFFKTIII